MGAHVYPPVYETINWQSQPASDYSKPLFPNIGTAQGAELDQLCMANFGLTRNACEPDSEFRERALAKSRHEAPNWMQSASRDALVLDLVTIRIERPDGKVETVDGHDLNSDFSFKPDIPGDYRITMGAYKYDVGVDFGESESVQLRVFRSAKGDIVNAVSSASRKKMIEFVRGLRGKALTELANATILSSNIGYAGRIVSDPDIQAEILRFAGADGYGAMCALHADPGTNDLTRKVILEHMEKTPATPAPYRGFRPGVVQAPIASPYPGKSLQWHSHERMDKPDSERDEAITEYVRMHVGDALTAMYEDVFSRTRPADVCDNDVRYAIFQGIGIGDDAGTASPWTGPDAPKYKSMIVARMYNGAYESLRQKSGGYIPWIQGFGMVGSDGPEIYGLVTPEEAKAESEHKRMTTSQNMHINVLGRKDATPIVRDEFSFTDPDGYGHYFTFYDDADIAMNRRCMEDLRAIFESWRKKADEANAQCARLQASCEAMLFVRDRNVAENAKLMEDNAILRRALYGNGKAKVTVDNGWDD